jgi:hypothetical protein
MKSNSKTEFMHQVPETLHVGNMAWHNAIILTIVPTVMPQSNKNLFDGVPRKCHAPEQCVSAIGTQILHRLDFSFFLACQKYMVIADMAAA